MIEVIILAFALSMDAFAVSLTLGTQNPKQISKVAILAGVYFGIFQAIMPLFGYLGGITVFEWLGNFAHWIAFVLLIIIGLKMIYEAIISQSNAQISTSSYTHFGLLMLAIATSIDALVAGFTLPLMSVDGITSCIVIGIATFVFSYLGVHIGLRASHYLGNKAELFGGLVLVLLAFKVLFV